MPCERKDERNVWSPFLLCLVEWPQSWVLEWKGEKAPLLSSISFYCFILRPCFYYLMKMYSTTSMMNMYSTMERAFWQHKVVYGCCKEQRTVVTTQAASSHSSASAAMHRRW